MDRDARETRMPRKRRIYVRDGIYYIVRQASQPLFHEDADYLYFCGLVSTCCRATHTHVLAYCLEPLAIHLVVQVADLPPARVVQRLMSAYVARMHAKHGGHGAASALRHRELIVDRSYLTRLAHYVAWLPVFAELTLTPEEYRWSCHNAYLGWVRVPWLYASSALRLLGRDSTSAREAYRTLTACPPDNLLVELFQQGSALDPRIVGGRGLLSTRPPASRRQVDISPISSRTLTKG
jgi:REP element-mobilizing transposase RayT